MQSKNLIICDSEEGYAEALAQYLVKKEELNFQIQTCRDFSCVLDIQEKAGIDYLFISGDHPREERRQLKAEKVFVLTDKTKEDTLADEETVFKYRPADEILAQLIRSCTMEHAPGELFLRTAGRKDGKVIGVYSPVHRIGKTSYALELGERLAEDANVLYLNLEVYGGVGGHFPESGQTLSDLVYYARQERGNLGLILTTLVKHKGKLDYVNPMQVSEDMKKVSATEWTEIVRTILEESIYETIVLDIDEAVPDLYLILRMCSEIHLITVDNSLAEAKIRQFYEELTLLGYDDVRRRIFRKEQRA